MIDVLQSLRDAALEVSPYPATSRYYGIAIATLETSDGRVVAYLRRRFLPPSDRFTVVREHTVRDGDRLDTLAAQYLGDPEQSWRLCDANDAMHPRALTEEPGRVIGIALPEGYGGPGSA
jgi:hypothetical protein